jgi:hypothetical protein
MATAADKARKKAYREANKEAIAAKGKAYHEANKEAIAAKGRAYREANKEKIKARVKVYREANKEKIKARVKAWHDANKERMKAYREANKEKIAAQDKAHRQANKERERANEKAYYAANREKIRERCKERDRTYYRARRLALKFGVPVADIELLERLQDRCAICEIAFTKRRPCIDHCHRSGKVRGRLCGSCNLLIGQAMENPRILGRAIQYLEDNAMPDPDIRRKLLAMRRAKPYLPYNVRLGDGNSFLVEHPENASWGQHGRDLVVHDKQGMHLLDLRLVDLIEPVPSERTEGGA